MSGLGKQVFVQMEALSSDERDSFLNHIEMFTTNPTIEHLAKLVFMEAVKEGEEYYGPEGKDLGPWLWQCLDKKGGFNSKTLSTDLNRLKKCLDRYFAFIELKDGDNITQVMALRAYRRRSVSQLSRGHISSLKKETQTVGFWSLLRRVELYLLEAEHFAEGLKRKKNQKVHQFLGALDNAGRSLEQLANLGKAMLETTREHYEFMFNEPWQYEPGDGSRVSDEVAQIYHDLTQVIRRLKGYQPGESFGGEVELKGLIKIGKAIRGTTLSPFHGRDLYGMMIALTVPLVNHGVEGASKETFKLLQEAYTQGFLTAEGKMDAKTFKVILESSLEQEEVEFAEKVLEEFGSVQKLFLKDNQQKTDQASIQVLLDYAGARISLLQGNFKKARKLASQTGLKDSLFLLSQRWVEILATYHLSAQGEEEWMACEDLLRSFSRTLEPRVKQNVYYQASLYHQRIPYFSKLVAARQELCPRKQAELLDDLASELEANFRTKGGRAILELVWKARKSLG